MGLDMHLTKNTYIGANYEHNKVSGTIQIEKDGKEIPIQFNRVSTIIEEVGYWRKANQIHNWFVKNIQHNVDNCEEYFVSKEQLKTLLKICKQVLKNKELASELLPTTNGFFFGGTEYDEYYFKDIKHTISILESLDLKNNKINSIIITSYYYSSSW